MSREALALDISRVVSRVVSGEAIDTAERGAALAAKYPDLGMSGDLIGEAIARAAGMVGMIKSAPPPPKPVAFTPRPAKVETPADIQPPLAPVAATVAEVAPSAVPRPSAPIAKPKPAPASPKLSPAAALLSIDDDLAAAIDAEIGNLVTGRKEAPAAPSPPVGNGHASVGANGNGHAEPKGSEILQATPSLADTPASSIESHTTSARSDPPPPKGPLSALRRVFFRG